MSPVELFDQHKEFGRRYEHLKVNWRRPSVSEREPDARIRIGFVSGDLRHHPVAALLEPVWASLANDSRFILHAYYSHSQEDEVSQRFRALIPHWRNDAWVDDTELVRLVRNDRVDILIDRSGHTSLNRLTAFARKPAPIQLSWLGYPFTTGLAVMDYFVRDKQWVPTEELESRFVEKMIQLPVAATFLPSALAPTVNSLPLLANGYITFASFNRISKLNSATLRGWLGVLRACVGSRLLIGAILATP